MNHFEGIYIEYPFISKNGEMDFPHLLRLFQLLKETKSFLIPRKNQKKTCAGIVANPQNMPNPEFQAVSKFAEVVSWSICCSQSGPPKMLVLVEQESWNCWVVATQIFFIFTLGKIPNLTNIFQRGWNHQLFMKFPFFLGNRMQTSVIGVQVVKKSSEKWLDDPGSEDTGHSFRELKGNSKVWKKTKSMRILPFNKKLYESMNHSHPKNGQNSKKKTPYNSLCPFLGWFSKVVGDLQIDLGNQRVSNWITWTTGWAARLNPPSPKGSRRPEHLDTHWRCGTGASETKKTLGFPASENIRLTVNPSLTAVPVRNKIMAFFLGWEKNPEESSQWFGPDC